MSALCSSLPCAGLSYANATTVTVASLSVQGRASCNVAMVVYKYSAQSSAVFTLWLLVVLYDLNISTRDSDWYRQDIKFILPGALYREFWVQDFTHPYSQTLVMLLEGLIYAWILALLSPFCSSDKDPPCHSLQTEKQLCFLHSLLGRVFVSF